MDHTETSIQKDLIATLENLCPANMSLADILADLLDISKDSAYRRIRCETLLNIDELLEVSKYFKISIDNILNIRSNSVVFDYNSIKNIEDYKQYLRSIIHDLKELSKFDDVKVIYAAQDIPLFHNFRFARLARFKLFYWLRSIVNAEEFQDKKFSDGDIDEELVSLGAELYDAYSRVPSDEIWTEISPVSLFKQVEFCWSSGLFESQEQALEVCNDVEEEFTDLEQQARSGIKNTTEGKPSGFKKNFNLYLSEIEIGNNCIFTRRGDNKMVYLAYNTFNKITTTNQPFGEEINIWLLNLMRKSTPISEVSEKHRYQFFKKLHKGLEDVREKIMRD